MAFDVIKAYIDSEASAKNGGADEGTLTPDRPLYLESDGAWKDGVDLGAIIPEEADVDWVLRRIGKTAPFSDQICIPDKKRRERDETTTLAQKKTKGKYDESAWGKSSIGSHRW